MGQRVLNVSTSNNAVLTVFMHCSASSKSGGVTLSFLNLHESDHANLSLPISLQLPEVESYVLTAGKPISSKSNPLQSREILLNDNILSLNHTSSPPTLPSLVPKHISTRSGYVSLPTTTYGFLDFTSANIAACLL